MTAAGTTVECDSCGEQADEAFAEYHWSVEYVDEHGEDHWLCRVCAKKRAREGS